MVAEKEKQKEEEKEKEVKQDEEKKHYRMIAQRNHHIKCNSSKKGRKYLVDLRLILYIMEDSRQDSVLCMWTSIY